MFKQKLQFLMKEGNVSVTTLSKELNIAKSCISGWKNGIALPKFDKAILLCQYFDCSLNFLFGNSEFEEKAKPYNIVNFGKHIKGLLKDKKIKQEKFFADLDLSSSNISYWSKDNTFPQMEIIIKIANYLNVSIDYLVGSE